LGGKTELAGDVGRGTELFSQDSMGVEDIEENGSVGSNYGPKIQRFAPYSLLWMPLYARPEVKND
jgi:hypothetical protein